MPFEERLCISLSNFIIIWNKFKNIFLEINLILWCGLQLLLGIDADDHIYKFIMSKFNVGHAR